MTSPVKKLLLLGTLLWVAPVGAEPSESVAWSEPRPACPYAHGEAAGWKAVVIKAEAPVLDHRGPGATLLP